MERKCFLCGRNGNGDPLEKHHIFGGNPNRSLSEKYGLWVYLAGTDATETEKDPSTRTPGRCKCFTNMGRKNGWTRTTERLRTLEKYSGGITYE